MSWLSRAILSLKHRFFRTFIFRTVKSIAKTQLRSFYAVQSRFPNLPNEELYYHTIMSRPGYTEETVRQILEDAKRHDAPLRLRNVVHALVMEEVAWEFDPFVSSSIESRFEVGGHPARTESSFSSYYEIVCEIIPSDI